MIWWSTLTLGLLSCLTASAWATEPVTLTISIDTTRPGRSFRPDEAFGAGVDGAWEGDVDRLFTPHNIKAMSGAGLRPLTYRLRTELGINAWHWNPVGQWSDPASKQGYWTSDPKPVAPIQLSWGYRLPRRGDTVDNANNYDYSRLTDGDLKAFWKSNPWLDPLSLKDGEHHPQWAVVRLAKPMPVDTAIIDWGTPHALDYAVQYWTGDNDYDPKGQWLTFEGGAVSNGAGGQATLKLANTPATTRYLRVLLTRSANNAPVGSVDWRDGMGFAINELSFGTTANGVFTDYVVHAPSHDGQSFAHVSSTDPWHRESDRDVNLEQPGIDRVFTSPLANGLPVMVATGLLFDTPENAESLIRYLAARNYPVKRIELGEEADGQYANPDDYAALYLALHDRLNGIIPDAVFGGPSLQSAFTNTYMLPEQRGSWNARFVDYLKRRGRLNTLGFVSFEYYPFDDLCGDIHAKLIATSSLLDAAFRQFERDGVPLNVPRIIAEYGFSAFAGRAMSEMPSALLMAGIMGQWLELGGDTSYLFGYGPNWPMNQHLACAGSGNMMLHRADENGQATLPMPTYYAGELVTNRWAVPGHGLHHLLPVTLSGVQNDELRAHALKRPDGRIALLIINRARDRAYNLKVEGTSAGEAYQYDSSHFTWIEDGANSRPAKSIPPRTLKLKKGASTLNLTPASLTVVLF